MDNETKKRLMVEARDCETFEEFDAGLGWEDWMYDYTTAEDGDPCSEKELNEISRVLRAIYKDAHEE